MIMSWQQSSGSLVTAGNSSTIRLWDMSREQCVRVFQTGMDTCTTALSSLTLSASQSAIFSPHTTSNTYSVDFDPPPWAWVVAGFADGTISIFDERIAYYGGKVHSVKDHRAWIVSTHLRLDIPEIVSASVSGTVKFMDVRSMRTYKTIEVHKSPLTAMAVHK
jgi:regulator-associated protein of mTOR